MNEELNHNISKAVDALNRLSGDMNFSSHSIGKCRGILKASFMSDNYKRALSILILSSRYDEIKRLIYGKISVDEYNKLMEL